MGGGHRGLLGVLDRAGFFDVGVEPAQRVAILTDYQALAAVPMPAVTALPGLRDKGQLQPGHKVLIHGASGTSGAFAQEHTVLSILLLQKGARTDVTKSQFSTLHLFW